MRGEGLQRVGWGGALIALVFACGCASGPQHRQDPIVLTPPPVHREQPIVLEAPKKKSEAPKMQIHRVQPGETLYHVAHEYDVPVDGLAQANHIADPRSLTVGQDLVIPNAPEAAAAAQVDDEAAPTTPAAPGTKRSSVRHASAKVVVPVGHVGGVLDWPMRGVLYARFARGQDPHEGIDLAAPTGTPVKTAAPGTVIYAGEQEGYGLIAIVEHADGLITLYAHNRDLRVKNGQSVREGQVIATVGESGRTRGPHLHFEVRKNGKPVDPLLFLKPPPRS